MAFDGVFLHKLLAELREAKDCHIDKIYQPSKDELVLLLRKKGFVKRLLINVKAGAVRMHFTEEKTENPAVPPNFCMLLRKYISSARVIDIFQPDLERVAVLRLSASNEMGDIEAYSLVCELIANKGNIILLRENGRIVDALKHSDVETAKRLILPNAVYEYPERQKKQNPFTNTVVNNEITAERLLNTFDGFSPLICREIEHRGDFKEIINSNKGYLLSAADGTPADFSYAPIYQYGSAMSLREYGSFSALLDDFYGERERAARIKAASQDITRLVKNLYNRTQKRLALRLQELKSCENREALRIYGELLKANLFRIKAGDSVAEVENYYDENLSVVKIPLNPAISPAKNAEKYFKEYKKTYTAANTLTALTESDRQELEYFESVLDSISRCESIGEIGEIREELAEGGYIKRTVKGSKGKPNSITVKEYKSSEGFKILVGKNNTQNDYLTTRLASKGDMWFHTKDIAGSHVLVLCDGKEISDETIVFAATLAAENSKARNSSKVAVDYTSVKFVKKPNGAKAGMVIYTNNKTVYVNPKGEKNL